jgi:alkyl hydroperoxide reductase subunit AhpC
MKVTEIWRYPVKTMAGEKLQKSSTKVMAAAERFGIRYPIVQDTEKRIWTRYGIWAWPTLLLVDKQGIIRYRHIGEGNYAEIEATIQALLAEVG